MSIVKKAQRESSTSSFQTETLEDYDLGGVDCQICENSGIISYQKDGFLYSRECDCMKKRRMLRAARKSGMEDMLNRYTFKSFETFDEKTKEIKRKAKEFTGQDLGWFFIAGRPGSGKSHICTAICNELIQKGKAVRYMLWRDDAVKLKAMVNDEGYSDEIDKLKKVSVLYIDDFLKGNYTDADIKLAFEILNSRYNNSKLRTVISTEININRICEIDEAVGSRIYERSKGFCLTSPKENYRLR